LDMAGPEGCLATSHHMPTATPSKGFLQPYTAI
jgi:hypothetical protein